MRWLFGLGLLLLSLVTSASLKGLEEALAAGNPLTPELRQQAEQSPQGLFLLGWLAESGRYGEPRDADKAADYFQRAAEAGSFAALEHCWQRCVVLNEAIRNQLRQGVEQHQPQALYLSYRAAREQGGDFQEIDRLLLQAARAGSSVAIGELYAQHFLDWAGGRRSVPAATLKLERCRQEGVIYCYYLAGALHQRQGDNARALHYFQLLAWLDPALFARYLDAGDLQRLQARLPQQNREPIRARAALQLSTQPPSGNPRIDRFGYCAEQRSVACVAGFAERDPLCLPAELENTLVADFRASSGYRACLGDLR